MRTAACALTALLAGAGAFHACGLPLTIGRCGGGCVLGEEECGGIGSYYADGVIRRRPGHPLPKTLKPKTLKP
eukprot:7726750-Pyramimonas_sp.AAC.1